MHVDGCPRQFDTYATCRCDEITKRTSKIDDLISFQELPEVAERVLERTRKYLEKRESDKIGTSEGLLY
jgi:hypothetical protein